MAQLTGRKVRLYSDLNLNFTKHPATSDIAKHTNETAVKEAVKNLIRTNFSERPFQPYLGSNVTSYLFEPADALTKYQVEEEIRRVIQEHEPRAEITKLDVKVDPDLNDLKVDITFKILNIYDPLDVSFYIARTR